MHKHMIHNWDPHHLFWRAWQHRKSGASINRVALTLMVSALCFAVLRPGIAHAQTESPNRDRGILVAAVHAGSPAAAAGVVRGDILMAVNDEPVDLTAELVQMLDKLAPESDVTLSVLHGDDLRTLTATLGARGAVGYLGIVACCDASPMGNAAWIGALPDLPPFTPPNMADDFRLHMAQPGALITKVAPDSPAAMAGLQAGDQIIAVDSQAIDGDHELADIIATHKPGDEVTLEVQRSPAMLLSQKEIEATESASDEADTESEEGEEASSAAADDQDAQTDPTHTAPAVGMHQRQTETVVVTLGENPDKAGGAYLGIYYTDGVNARPFANGPMAENRFFVRPFDGQPFGQYRFFHGAPHAYGMPGDMPNAGMETQAVIMQVLPDSPAAAAGLQKGEVIVALNGEPLTDPAQLKEQIAQLAPGDEIVLTVRQPAQATAETDSDKTDSEEAVPAESNAEDTGAEREVTVTLGENEQGETWLGVEIGLLIQMNQTDTQ